MSAKPFYIPAAGMRVVDPANGEPLPPEGREVSGNEIYWLRRVRDVDVTEGKPASQMPASSAKGKKE